MPRLILCKVQIVCVMKEIIRLDNIKRDFHVGDETVHALRGVSFTIHEGEFVTIMGTSGSGKSTLLNTLGCLDTPTSGEYYLDGVSVRTMNKRQRATLRNRKIGFVFQNYNLLPKTTAVENVELPLMYNPTYKAAQRREKAVNALIAVGLGDRLMHKSNQMSGGQMQRVAIARALALEPEVIIMDEATSALDVSVQKTIIELITKLQREKNITIGFICHDIALIEQCAHQIAVMYLGKIVEIADAGEVFMHPVHPYTKALTQAAPVADPGRREEKSAVLTGEVASAVHPPKGCRFHPRCPYAREDCSVSDPMLLPMAEKPDHLVACPYYEGTETA